MSRQVVRGKCGVDGVLGVAGTESREILIEATLDEVMGG
jgi:hypothetical protein